MIYKTSVNKKGLMCINYNNLETLKKVKGREREREWSKRNEGKKRERQRERKNISNSI